jgi:hypothetical protein
MRYRLIALPVIILSWYLDSGRAIAQPVATSYLQVSPYEGHPGAPIIVMGAGLPRNTKEVLMIACPDALHPGPNVVIEPGPRTDSQGSFVGFKMRGVTPVNLTAPLTCTLYASVGASGFGPDIRPTYLVLPPHQPLNNCAIHICHIHVKSTPIRVRYGVQERVIIHDPGWPGAFASILLHYTGRPSVTRKVQLDIHGAAFLHLPVQVHVPPHGKPLKVAVSVHLQLGGHTGGGGSSFFVVH